MAASKTPGYVTISSLPADRQAACRAAIATSNRAYCPYSKFSVGAALIHADGTITAGANWENCTFQVTCAERCAIVAANAQGKRAATCCAIYGRVTGSTVNPKDFTVTAPCGLCRQMLNETHVRLVKLSTLLPLAFGPSDCGLDISAFVPPPPSAAAASPSKIAAAEASKPKVVTHNAKKKAASAAPKPAANAATKKRK